MKLKRRSREEKLKRIEKVICKRKDNIIYVDFVFLSMHEAIDTWFKDNYKQEDPYGYARNGHLFLLERFYNPAKFKNHDTIGKERDNLLIELDNQSQLRKID